MTNERNTKSVYSLYKKALLIRLVEQRLLALFGEGRLFGTVHTCIGQEFTGIAVAEALEPRDFIFSNHRCHGHYIARTDDVEGLIAEIMGKVTGICGGLGGSQHICASGVFSNGVQGGITPVSTGMAMAEKLRGTNNIGVVFIGDGTLGEGVLYESLNIASLWSVPLLFVCENNYYAQSTHQSQNLAGDICQRARAFGIETAHSNTWDPEGLIKSIAGSVQKVRSEKKPFFHRIDTYRLMAHSKGDDSRDPKVVQEYWVKDPVQRFISDHKVESEEMLADINKRIDSAVDRAEKSPYPSEKSVVNKVNSPGKTEWEPTELESHNRIAEVIYEALKRNMRKDERILLIGEDIEAPYGGAFKVTKDLSELFPGKVRNTPISEAAIIGIGNGLALNGMVPICEIMFGGFLALGMDQLLNHASKFRHMYSKQVKLPLVVRTPMGGRRGYGPTHSQSIEKHFLGLPDLRVFAINERYSPGQFYDRLLDGIISPALVIENKLLYGSRIGEAAPSGYILEHTTETFATTRLRPLADPDVTIVCYGGMLSMVEETLDELFYEHEIICEVIVPMLLYPLNPWPIVESVHKTGKILVVEEGVGFADFGSEVITQVVELSGSAVRQAGRLCCPAIPVPSCAVLEKKVLPGKESILKKVVELANG